MASSSSRRKFLLGSGVLGSGLILGSKVFSAAFAAEKGAKKGSGEGEKKATEDLIDEKSGLASTLKYQHDASKVPAGLRVKKGGLEGAQQFCNNCMFYKKEKGEAANEVGKCQLFPKGLVKGQGWCNSWTKKA